LTGRQWNIAGLVLVGLIGFAAMFGLPYWLELSALLDATVYVILAILALSLALVWGYGGILCFGQSAFFGLGAYVYAIAMFNMGESTAPFLLAVAAPAAFAALLGYFMFYGRISDVYLGVITLTVTLILFNSVNSTAGPEYHIGVARLGGFNGIPSIPPLNVPGEPQAALDLYGMFYLSMTALLLTYFGLRWLLASRFGRVMVAIRENERRAEFVGYDTTLYKLVVFAIGGGVAGLAGCLFANWGAFVSPTIFGLAQSAQIIIWVIVGGRGTLIGPVAGCIAIQWFTAYLGSTQIVSSGALATVKAMIGHLIGNAGAEVMSSVLGVVDLSNANLALGAVLLAFVLLAPKGVAPGLLDLFRSFASRRRQKAERLQRPADGVT
jgi:ABC-type branched-subunit amino acid transport system permease subunit